MKKLIKTLAVLTAGVGAVAVVKRASKKSKAKQDSNKCEMTSNLEKSLQSNLLSLEDAIKRANRLKVWS